MKVICPGLSKTGTKSMREALEILGYKNIHDVMEQTKFDQEILRKAMLKGNATVEDFKNWYQDIDAITDIPGIYVWKELYAAFPHTKVVLTVRDSPEEWLKSFQNMTVVDKRDLIYFRYYRIAHLLFANWLCPSVKNYLQLRDESTRRMAKSDSGWNGVSLEYAKDEYIKRIEDVKTYVPKSQLLVFKVTDGWEPLCSFLGKDVPNVPFPKNNIGHSIFKDIDNQAPYYRDAGLTQTLNSEVQRAILIYFSGVVFIIGCIITFAC